jgi:uncharacterized repeat protein (TIGR01451 family)
MLRASDHADGPTVAGDQGADLADAYMFVDKNDPSKLVIINTVRGFIVPGEAVNFAVFDSTIRYRFQIENTGPVNALGKPIAEPLPTDTDFDPVPDAFIDVSFSKKTSAAPQTATVVFTGSAFADIPRGKYEGQVRAATLDAMAHGPNGEPYFPTAPKKLTLARKHVEDPEGPSIPVDFFAGEVDDPFFFDIPAFSRFRNRFLANLANPMLTRNAALDDAKVEFNRARDTFAGYNVMAMAFRIPIALLKNKNVKITNTTKFGLNVLAQRRIEKSLRGEKIPIGGYGTVDREGLPAVNALLVPLAQKNAYNGGTTVDDSKLKFAAGILGTLDALKVQGEVGNPATPLGLLAKLAVLDGDILRIDTSLSYANPGAHFPNGRRVEDDVVATLLSVIASNMTPGDVSLDDNVTENDVDFPQEIDNPMVDSFPFLGLPHQPLPAGATDPTKN